AQYNLGLMYDEGDGVDVNKEKAIYWYTKAAEQGGREAQNNLGALYQQGDG
ncbi:sel1 repeat family protein, partial [Gilliamella sp. B3976]|nr:sel1 repeat family protein [Gilliamella sp. B3976]